MFEATYEVAPKGLATNYTESELPVEFASQFRNRFINAAGGAEKRPGMAKFSTVPVGNGAVTLDASHELIKPDGTAVLFVSGEGRIYRFDDPAWTLVHTMPSPNRLQSVQMNEKLIFVNGADRNVYTEDGEKFHPLRAIVEQGKTSSPTSATGMRDVQITDWTLTDVAVNDLIRFPAKDCWAVITSVGASNLTFTAVGSAGNATGEGVGNDIPEAGTPYWIEDMIELNVIPSGLSGVPDDNVAVAGPGTTTQVIAVSGVNFADTVMRVGDWIHNTTRNAISQVTAVSARINLSAPIASQAAGDSIVFLSPAMPIAHYAHVHYGRLYMVDARDRTRIVISGAEDPQDISTDAGTLDSMSFRFGSQQPQGETILALASFQAFFAIVGQRNIYLYSGTTPIPSSATANDDDFAPVALFPQGGISTRGVVSIGNDLAFVTPDGVQAASQVQDATTLNRTNLSEPIRNLLRAAIADADPESEIQLFHYPRRSWLMLRVGSQMFVYNYSALIGEDNDRFSDGGGSWSLFDGRFARQRDYFVRANGDLIAVGAGGTVYKMDVGFSDDGDPISTTYRTGWLTLEETGRARGSVRVKKGQYIKPVVESGANVTYRIEAEAPYDRESSDVIVIPASGGAQPIGLAVVGETPIGGSPVSNRKFDLRWRGEVVRLTFHTEHTTGPDIISRYTLYANITGRK